MEQYSHGEFKVTGFVVTIPNKAQEQEVINQAWLNFDKMQLNSLVEPKAYPSLHAIYFNYTNPTDKELCGYDMLIGYITDDTFATNNPLLQTITIPAQDYNYLVTKTCTPPDIQAAWENINSMSSQELNRAYGYDLEMYSENFDYTTIALAVNEANETK
jgi:Integron-associated effector binding protein